MKKIGLIGGISWTSTIDYYRIINEKVNDRLEGLNFAECLIYSVNFKDFATATSNHDWEATFQLLSAPAVALQNAGVEALLLCANTAHIVAEKLGAMLRIPIIDIRLETIKIVKAQKLKKVGLLGTIYTMELDFYKSKFAEAGIEIVIPENRSDRLMMEDTLLNELGKGIMINETKQKYLAIIDQLIASGAEGIILGCTEIPLLIKSTDVAIPIFNTTAIHAEAAVKFALEE
ncbi:MAG: amino acid racemase [Flavobacterium sp.]|uniref:aspartate/glutamate racemase family protein n=1 Tax=Flavobacterium sp. TaxID=239 RepID=UPI003266352D